MIYLNRNIVTIFAILIFHVSNIPMCFTQKIIDLGVSMGIEPDTIIMGNTDNKCHFTLYNASSIPVDIGCAQVKINYPIHVYDLTDTVGGGDFYNYFGNWIRDGQGLWYGINTAPLPPYWYTTGSLHVIGIDPTGYYNDSGIEVDFNALCNYHDPEYGNSHSESSAVVVAKPLPVTLIDFSGISKECGVVNLTWHTESELNNNYFEIQRSLDGRNYATIGKVNGKNASTGATYTYTDHHELKNGMTYYYRLRQVDLDGKAVYHKVITVANRCIDGTPELSIYPNPAIDKVSILLTNLAEGNYKGVIINHDGAEVRHVELNPNTAYEMEVKDLPAGVYNLRILDQRDNLTKNFIRIQ